MKQQVNIDGLPIDYSIETKNVILVLGQVYIYKMPQFDDILKIVYLGLERTGGYSQSEFIECFRRGEIYTSKKKGQYSMSQMRWRIIARVRQINKTYKT